MKKVIVWGFLVSLFLGQLTVLAEEGLVSSYLLETESTSSSETFVTTNSNSSSSDESSSSLETTSSKELSEKEETKASKSPETKEEKEKEAGLEEKKDQEKQEEEPSFVVSVNYTTQEFIKKIGEDARTLGQERQLYASVMIAQAILESGSGNSGLAQPPYHNLFGIKGSYEGASVTMATQEDDGTGKLYTIKDAFRSYPNYRASLKDYADLLRTPLYRAAWKENAPDYQTATRSLTGLYATDKYYNHKLDALIEAYDLTQYDHETDRSLLERYPNGDYPDYDGKDYPGAEAFSEISARFAYNRMSQLGGHLESNFGLPTNWVSSALQQDYEAKQEVKVGTVVSLKPKQEKAGREGQVAVVEKVYPSGAILISEYGKFSSRLVSFRVIDAVVAQKLTYITPKIKRVENRP